MHFLSFTVLLGLVPAIHAGSGCTPDNCYDAVMDFQRTATSTFCSNYMATQNHPTPTELSNYGSARCSSACSCMPTSTTLKTSTTSSWTPPSSSCTSTSSSWSSPTSQWTSTSSSWSSSQSASCPASTVTLSGSTATVTATETGTVTDTVTLPAVISTITLPAMTATITLSASTETETDTVTITGTTILSASTDTVTVTTGGATVTSTACPLRTPTPTSASCPANGVVLSSDNSKNLITPATSSDGGASLDACAALCASTDSCVSFAYAAPVVASNLAGICDLYDTPVSSLDIITADLPTTQQLQSAYDLTCFSCGPCAASSCSSSLTSSSTTPMATITVTLTTD